MMKKRIKAKAEKLTIVKSAKETPVPAPQPEPMVIPQVDPSSFEFPINTTFEMDHKMHRVVRAYRSDNEEIREVASEGDITVIMLKTLRKDAVSSRNFTIFP